MLKRINRIRDRRAIEEIFKGKFRETQLFRVYKRTAAPPPKFLVIASGKKIKQATNRNRIRRRLHEAFREIMRGLPADTEVIVVVKPETLTAAYQKIKQELTDALS